MVSKSNKKRIIYCVDCGKPKEFYLSMILNSQWYGKSDDGEVRFYRCKECYFKSVRGKPRSEQIRKKISKTKQGIKFSKEHKTNLGLARIEGLKSGRIKVWNDGIPRSEETKEKLRFANKGKVLSVGTREKISVGISRGIVGRKYGYRYSYFFSERFGKKYLCRSSLERKAISFFENIPFVTDVEYETLIIPYEMNGYVHIYIPDYLLKSKSGDKVLVEVKSEWCLSERVEQLKFAAAVKYVVKKGMSFCVLTEKELTNVNSVETTLVGVIQSATAAISNRDDDIVRTA